MQQTAIACPFIVVMRLTIVNLLKCQAQETKAANHISYDEAEEESATPAEG